MPHQPVAPPTPPYHVVVFVSRLARDDPDYAAMARLMAELAAEQPGYLGHESARDPSGVGITVSYWRDAAAIAAWKSECRHSAAQRRGARDWYDAYTVHVAQVERCYAGPLRP